MATITLEGNPIHTAGELPAKGKQAPDFCLTNKDMGDTRLADFAGKKIIMNVFVSIDTGICADSTRRFNEEVSKMDNTVALCISADLPFALARYCGAEGLDNVITLSAFRSPEFGKSYGLGITDGPIRGLMSRAIIIIDESGKVIYTQQVPEIAQDPDFEDALAHI